LTPYLDRPVSSLKGVGPKRAARIKNLGAETIGELIRIFPRKYEDRREVCQIKDLSAGRPAAIVARVAGMSSRRLFGRGRSLAECSLYDESGRLRAVWFNARGPAARLNEGARAFFYGTPERRGGELQIVNPDFCLADDAEAGDFARIAPIYPATEGLSEKWYSRLVAGAVRAAYSHIKESLPQEILKRRGLMGLADSIAQMHMPDSPDSWKEARRRLAYEELFDFQLKLANRRERFKRQSRSFRISGAGSIYRSFRETLPFPLTASQENALNDIFKDMARGEPMLRLLQGDVGSGKTLVAVGAAAAAADAGAQTVMMAPTEVLARQLCAEAEKHLAPLGIKSVLLTGSLSARDRREALASAADGSAAVIAGTQALIEEGVSFKRLGLAVIDEQHRFGVGQRSKLMNRDPAPDVLMMSATPIPRTLTLTIFGDLDISELREKPPGRRKVETRLIGPDKMGVLLRFIVSEARAGGRTYWVCPRIEDGLMEAASAERRFGFLKKHIGKIGVGLLHGRMGTQEKEEAIERFRTGEINVLVSTTVIEVGVDVPEASLIVIENAELFGLAQLHQLRGRVGRGGRRGVCVMVARPGAADERLSALLDLDDGFAIAEADLSMRGTGELSGYMQHGLSEFKVADLSKDAELLAQARKDAAHIVTRIN
jgi:ATP-dependent DNA helicase RecG